MTAVSDLQDLGVDSTALIEAYHFAEVQIESEVVQQMLEAFKSLNPSALDASTAGWIDLARSVIADGRSRSAELSAVFNDAYTHIETGQDFGPGLTTLASVVPEDSFLGSMIVTGPAAIKQATASGVDLADAVATAADRNAAAGQRLVANGGRETTLSNKLAVGFYRQTTSAAPCAFCMMLASRGPVYHSEQSAGFEAHDGCSCIPVAVFEKGTPLTDQAKTFRSQWNSATSGLSGNDALNAFRRSV